MRSIGNLKKIKQWFYSETLFLITLTLLITLSFSYEIEFIHLYLHYACNALLPMITACMSRCTGNPNTLLDTQLHDIFDI